MLSQLLTEDPSTEVFILQLNEGKVVVRHCKSLSGGEKCDHVNEEQEADVTDEAEEQEHSNTDEEYVSCDEEEAILPAQRHQAIPDCQEEGATATHDQDDESVKWSKLQIHSKRPTNPTHHRARTPDPQPSKGLCGEIV